MINVVCNLATIINQVMVAKLVQGNEECFFKQFAHGMHVNELGKIWRELMRIAS